MTHQEIHERNVRIMADLRQGMTQTEAAKKYDMAQTSIGVIARKHGLNPGKGNRKKGRRRSPVHVRVTTGAKLRARYAAFRERIAESLTIECP
ncbi:MAG: hypothetical protein OXH34_01740 [Bacteroidetes bacterium]|nr:hypothetical protein [Bacteroidota bacterium]